MEPELTFAFVAGILVVLLVGVLCFDSYHKDNLIAEAIANGIPPLEARAAFND